ncbi:MAG: MAPEG family protein [Pseudomonadota bacterium]|nr:MAPEG family protein [Pseudomonadota bacterium]
MTMELTYLAWALVLAVVQILWADVARTGQYGLKWNTGARDEEMPPLKPMGARLFRAQSNLFETLPLFAAAVLIFHAVHPDSSSALSQWGARLYVWGRVLYVPLYAFGVKQVRSLVWLVSFAGLLMSIAACLLPS